MVPPSPPPPAPPPPSPSPPPPRSPVADAGSGVGTGGGDGDFLPIFILVLAVLIGIGCCLGCCFLAAPAGRRRDRRIREDFDSQEEYERWLEECDEDELQKTLARSKPVKTLSASASAQARLVEAIENSTREAQLAHLEKQGLLSFSR